MSRTICVVPVEYVLSDLPDLKVAQPQRWARPLVDSLKHEYRMIALTSTEADVADWWLRREMLTGWAGVMTQPDGYNSFTHWMVRQIEEFQSETWEVGLVIGTENHALDEISRLGVVTMMLRYPANRVGWREPGAPIREWTSVVDES
jgi:hypothetical protein